MSKLRWALEFSIFVLLGTSAMLVMSAYRHATRAFFILIGLTIILLSLAIFTQLLSNAAAVISSLTWWQILWVSVFLSGLVFRQRNMQSIKADPLDAWAFFRIALIFTTAVVLLWRSLRQIPWPQHLYRGLTGVLGVYCLVNLASSLWSVYPVWTFYKSLEFLVDSALLAAIVATAASVKTYKTFFDWTWTLEGLLVASIWLGLILWPQDALVPVEGLLGVQLSGVTPFVDPNSVGELGAVLGVITLFRFLRSNTSRSRVFYGLCFTMGLLTMCFAQARSAILGFAVGIILGLLASRGVAASVFLAFASAVLLSFGSVWQTLLEFMRRGETDDSLYTLSSRVDWWSFAWPKILEHPLTGYGGYAGARFFVMAAYKVDAGIHSDWLEILLGTGLYGFIPAVLVLLGTWCQLIRSIRDPSLAILERQLAIEAMGALAVVSIRSVFSPALFWHPPIVFFVALGYAELLRIRRKRSSINPSMNLRSLAWNSQQLEKKGLVLPILDGANNSS